MVWAVLKSAGAWCGLHAPYRETLGALEQPSVVVTNAKACHEAIADRLTAAIIPTRMNAKPWADVRAGDLARNELLKATQKLGRAIG